MESSSRQFEFGEEEVGAESETEKSDSEFNLGSSAAIPMILDIVLPPMIVLTILIIGILVGSIVTQNKWWKYMLCKRGCKQLKLHNKICTGTDQILHDPEAKCSPDGMNLSLFWQESDLAMIERLSCFQNQPIALFRLAMPAILSLAFCPVTLYLYPPMMKFFWPMDIHPTMPNVNDAISCFLTPAGLIYAIAFGFAFQEALGKQGMIEKTLLRLENIMKEVLLLVDVSCMTLDQCKAVTYFLKEETLTLIEMIMHKKTYKKSQLWLQREGRYHKVLKALKSVEISEGAQMEVETQSQLLQLMMELHGGTSDRSLIVPATLDLLQWTFLETLGFVAFFGVLVIQAQSESFQITLCMLTVFSISMFSYILADLDQTLHGIFRIDMSLMVNLLHSIRNHWSPNKTDA